MWVDLGTVVSEESGSSLANDKVGMSLRNEVARVVGG